MSKLDEVIDGIIEEKTFSLEAVEAIKKMRELNESQDKTIKQDIIDLEKRKEEITKLNQTIEGQRARITSWEDKQKELEERENKITDLEKSEAVEKGKANMLAHCFDTVFKNTVFKEDYFKNLPPKDQYGTPQTESGDTTKTSQPE